MSAGRAPGGLMEQLVCTSAAIIDGVSMPDGAAQMLLADLLACVAGANVQRDGGSVLPTAHISHDGSSGRVAEMALRAHSSDLDDIYWPAGAHLGSIVWPVVLALGAEARADGARIERAARMGYQVAGDTAMLLGPEHAARWHVTATAGTVGAAAAAAVVLGMDTATAAAACGHAAAMAGGVGQSVTERSAGVAYHRASAAVAGVLAARTACAGVMPAALVLEGPRGLLALLAPEAPGLPRPSVDVLAATSVRLFPVNGFSQAAVALAAGMRRRRDEAGRARAPRSITVEVAAPVVAATNGEVGGEWWDMRGAVAAAWSSGDEFHLERTADAVALRESVRVAAGSFGIGTTRVLVDMDDGQMHDEMRQAPGYLPTAPDSLQLLRRKWDYLGASDPLGRARQILDGGIDIREVDTILRRSAERHPAGA